LRQKSKFATKIKIFDPIRTLAMPIEEWKITKNGGIGKLIKQYNSTYYGSAGDFRGEQYFKGIATNDDSFCNRNL